MLKFADTYFQNEVRCNFHITSMMKRFWASEMESLAWVDSVCKKYDIKYVMFYGSLLGTVRHKGFIPWDDDIDIAMLRSDFNRFVEVVPSELPPYLTTQSLLPGAIPPKEMTFGVCNGNRLDTSPEFLERFHGCPYATGIDVFVLDKVPTDPDDFAYQDRLIRLLDRMLMLQWDVNDKKISEDDLRQYEKIRMTLEQELDFSFNDEEPMSNQILRMLDMACGLCDDCDSEIVENREQVIYYGERKFKVEYFNDRIWVPYENVMSVPIPRKYDEILRSNFGDYLTPVKYGSQHEYPAYKYQREALYKAYLDRNWEIPEEFLEYDEDGKLILDPSSL